MVYTKTSKEMRTNPFFLRNQFQVIGRWGIPVIKRQNIDISNARLISCADTRFNDRPENKLCGVHFFVDDYRFENIYRNPDKTLPKFSQYAFLLSPDFSTYADMHPWRQLESIAHSRWCGAYWQSKGLKVIPTISWSTPSSYSYCFDGVGIGSVVAVGIIGCRKNKVAFLRGYREMLKVIQPEAIICFGKPFFEMEGNVVSVDYLSSRKVVR